MIYTVNSKSFDRKVKRSWTAEMVESSRELLLLKGVFEQTVDHPALGEIAAGTLSFEYFWPDRWYNIFKFHHPNGKFRNFYCNIALPPFIGEGLVEFIDLDLDVMVDSEGGIYVLDEDEFAENAARYAYPREVTETVPKVLASLLRIVQEHKFPFDDLEQTFEKFVLKSFEPNPTA